MAPLSPVTLHENIKDNAENTRISVFMYIVFKTGGIIFQYYQIQFTTFQCLQVEHFNQLLMQQCTATHEMISIEGFQGI